MQLGDHTVPKRGALRFTNPETEKVLAALDRYRLTALDRLLDHATFVTYGIVNGIKEHERIDGLERATLHSAMFFRIRSVISETADTLSSTP